MAPEIHCNSKIIFQFAVIYAGLFAGVVMGFPRDILAPTELGLQPVEESQDAFYKHQVRNLSIRIESQLGFIIIISLHLRKNLGGRVEKTFVSYVKV